MGAGEDLSWLPPAVWRRLPAPPARLALGVLGAGGALLLLTVGLRTRSPRWGTAGAALVLIVVAGLACTPTGVAFYWVITDPLGTPIAMTNTPTSGEAEVIWKASHEPFGAATEDVDPDGDDTDVRMPVRFPGQWWDFASGLHYNFYRDYDPKTGRYLEADPVGQAGGLNVYVYAGNDSANDSDRTGLTPSPLVFPRRQRVLAIFPETGLPTVRKIVEEVRVDDLIFEAEDLVEEIGTKPIEFPTLEEVIRVFQERLIDPKTFEIRAPDPREPDPNRPPQLPSDRLACP